MTSAAEAAAAAVPPGPRLSPRIDEFDAHDVAGSSFDYGYVEAAIAVGELDGFRVGGSFPVTGPWIALTRFEYLSNDEGNADVDFALLSGGVGYVHPVRDDLDFVGSGELVVGDRDIETPGIRRSDDEVGLRARGGVRFQAAPKVELDGGVSLSTLFDEDVGLDGKALYAFDDQVSGFVGFELRDDPFFLAGLRFAF